MRGFYFVVIFFFGSCGAYAQLWVEDFNSEANGAQMGTANGTPGGNWSVPIDPSGTFNVNDDAFHINNTVTEGMWSTNVIDISTAGYAVISLQFYTGGVGFTDSDYLRFYYKVDGGPEILFSDIAGTLFPSTASDASAIVAGNTLQVIIRAVDNSDFFLPWLAGYIIVDDVTVTPADILYSRKAGTWTDVTGGFGGTGTWSTNRSGTPACGCVPLNNVVGIIQNGNTVTLPTSQVAVGGSGTPNLAPGAVDVESGGVLQYNTSGVTLGIQQGLLRVRSGGTVNSSSVAITGEQVSFNADIGGATLQVDAGGTMSLENLVIGTNATNFQYLAGGGTLGITGDILIDAAGATLTNNRSASFTVGDDVVFNGANSVFINNAAMTITDDILIDANNSSFTNNATSLVIGDDLNFNSDNSSFINNATASIADIVATDNGDDDNVVTNSNGATLTLGGIDANNADLDIYNSGTITQSGTFTDIDDGDTNFDNLATGIWNWTLTPNTSYDPDALDVLNLTAAGNTFNYSAAGAQRILPITHHHIELSNSGTKDANNASFSVHGDWTVTGSATFAEGTGTIALNGTTTQTITNSSGETFYNLVIDNPSGIVLQNDVTVSRVLTMDGGNVNLNGNSFALTYTAAGALDHGLTSADGWMYGGNFLRARPASTNIAVGSAHSFFPLGSASDWRPFFAGQSNATTAGTMTVTHINSTSTSTVSISDNNPMPAVTIVRRHNSYWTPRTTATGGSYTLRAGGTNFGTISSANHLQMATSTGTIVGARVAGSGSGGDWRVNRSGLTTAQLNANNFHLASTNAGSSPLPIELVSFSAQLKNNIVELNWKTASELNNDYFTIERAIDIEHFETILSHDGQGTSKELNHYKVIDSSPLYGRSYYRLKQTDFDGKFTYSDVRLIDYEGPAFATLTAFPNPVNTATLTLKIEGLKEASDVPVQILNLQGQKVFEMVVKIRTPGIITEEISRNAFPSPGLYIIKAGSTLYLTKKIVIE